MKNVQEIRQFLATDIWRIRTKNLKKPQSFWIKQLRICLLAVRRFDEDECLLRASALTFYSLLSIVPVIAMAFGVAKGFGFEKVLETLLIEKFPAEEEVVFQIIVFARSFLETTKGGVIAGFGLVFLFWTVIKVLGNIEKSFNSIWGVKKGRSLARRFSDYLSVMMIGPVLIIMASSLTVLVTTKVTLILENLAFLGPVSGIILYFLGFLPLLVMCGLFTFVYIFMPNTSVRFKSALIGGIFGAVMYQTVQWIYITFQIGVSKYGAIYGSFAALPLFLIWLQLSWLIVLFGAEISFAEQNVNTYEFEPDSLKASIAFKRLMALAVTQVCVRQFEKGETPMTAQEIAQSLELPIRLVNQVTFDLTEAKVLTEVKTNGENICGYQPARDPNELRISRVLELLARRGVNDIPYAETAEVKRIEAALESMSRAFKSSPDNLLLKDIV